MHTRAPAWPLALLLTWSFLLAGPREARADLLQLAIQPIQVCDASGTACANPGRLLFEGLTRSIWLQAGIVLQFLDWQRLESPELLAAGFDQITAAGRGDAGPFTVEVWFVNEITSCGIEIFSFACARQDAAGIAIAASVFESGRADTLAHELGHNLGLAHVLDPANLLAFGDVRLIPSSVSEVYPRGELGRLTQEQIALARGSSLLTPVPEPSSMVLMLGGGAAAALRLRGRRQTPEHRPRKT